MRAPAAANARPSESDAAKADRYFAEQCRRLGPVEPCAQPAPRRTGASRRLDRELRRVATT